MQSSFFFFKKGGDVIFGIITKFVFKNIRFDRNKPYYLIVVDEENNEIINKVKFYIERINID